MVCKNCGQKLQKDAAFCPKCGSQIIRIKQISNGGMVFLITVVLIAVAAVGTVAGVLRYSSDRKELESKAELPDAVVMQEQVLELQTETVSVTDAEPAQEPEQTAENTFDAYEEFGITQGRKENYAENLDTSAYRYYSSGITDFNFFYPAGLYGEIVYNEKQTESNYGTNMISIEFIGSAGAKLIVSLWQYGNMSIETMTETVYNTEMAAISDAASVIHKVWEDYGRVILTGTMDAGESLIWSMTKIEPQYVLQMQIISSKYQAGYADRLQKGYVLESLYRLCPFSGSSYTCRSYEVYKAETVKLDEKIEQSREWYYWTQDNLDNLQVEDRNGVIYVSDAGVIRKVTVPAGMDATGYARDYYYVDNRLYFALVHNNNVENRFYFSDDMLIRYIDDKQVTYDLEDADAHIDAASGFQKEAYALIGQTF